MDELKFLEGLKKSIEDRINELSKTKEEDVVETMEEEVATEEAPADVERRFAETPRSDSERARRKDRKGKNAQLRKYTEDTPSSRGNQENTDTEAGSGISADAGTRGIHQQHETGTGEAANDKDGRKEAQTG